MDNRTTRDGVAALLVAHELGCDVGPLFNDVYGRVSGMSV